MSVMMSLVVHSYELPVCLALLLRMKEEVLVDGEVRKEANKRW